MKKVLFITYCFPPLLGPESIQSSRYIKFLLEYGWESYILCVDAKYSTDPLDNGMLELVSDNIPSIKRARSYESGLFINNLARLFRFLVQMPDIKIAWYYFAYKHAISMLKTTKFDLIHSWAQYFTGHLVGLKIKKKTGLPWIAHFSDPWVDNPYSKYGRIDGFVNRKMEEAVIKNADAIVFVSEETRQLVMKKYPSEMMSKAFVIPHCYDEELQLTHTKRRNSKFTLTYTGNFYGNRTPVPLFRAIRNIVVKKPDIGKLLQIQIVGKLYPDYKNMISELGIEKVVSHIDVVPYMESLKYISNADVLLLIDAPSIGPSVFLPLKLIEYLGSGNPIFGITPLEGASANLIRKLGGIVVSPDDIDGIEKGILTLYEKYKSNDLPNCYKDKHLVDSYNAQNTTKILAELFNNYV